MYWQVVLAALTLAGYLESITTLSAAVEGSHYGDTQIARPEPC